MFHSGTTLYDFWCFEDCIAVKAEAASTAIYPKSNYNWGRAWETFGESSDMAIPHLTARSYISFYRYPTRKFTGNVYGDGFTFMKLFKIEGAIDKNALATEYEKFEFDVLSDIGEVETTLCGADFLAEFYTPTSNFLTVECKIDYANSTTNVNLHEDLTSTIETNFVTGTSDQYDGGGLFGTQVGSSSSNNQITFGG